MKKTELEALRKQLKADKERIDEEIDDLKWERYPISMKLSWLKGEFRYGDIVQLDPPDWRNPKGAKGVCLVVTYTARWGAYGGTILKKDGTLGVRKQSISRCKLVGRYEGDDLPAPDRSAQFGLDHREDS